MSPAGAAAVLGLLLAPAALSADAAGLRATIDTLASFESRVPGYPGNARAADYLERRLRSLGLRDLRRETFEVVVPVDRGAGLRVVGPGEAEVLLRCLEPNLARTSTLPADGLEAPLIDGGSGELADFDGQLVDGRVVLLDYDSWDHWRRAGYLGAAAVVFIEPRETRRAQGRSKSSLVPLDLPRFWVDRPAGLALRRRLQAGDSLTVRLRARMDWSLQPTWNLLGWVPGTDPALAADTIAVQAGYASTSPVPGLAPGAEEACGVAALLELAAHLRAHPPARTVLLLATSRGMSDFLTRHARSWEPAAERLAEPFGIDLFIGLDLSSQTDRLAVWHNTRDFQYRRYFAPFGRRFVDYDPARALINGISPARGTTWEALTPGGVSSGAGRAFEAGLPSLSFVTVHDGRVRRGTPHDRPEGVRFDNLERQTELLSRTLAAAFDDPGLLTGLEDFDAVLKDRLRTLVVHARAFTRQSQVPEEPVAGALVMARSPAAGPGGGAAGEGGRLAITDARGDAVFAGLLAGSYDLSAYVVDADGGGIAGALDLSTRAASHHGEPSPEGVLTVSVTGETNEKTVVLFPCTGRELYDLVDPLDMGPRVELRILDVNDAEPRQYGYAVGFGEALVFASAGTRAEDRIKIVINDGRALLLNGRGHATEDEARGDGFLLSRDRFPAFHLLAARDMWRLDEARLRRLREHAIGNPRVAAMHAWADRLIERAGTAARERDWTGYTAAAREALGVEARVYPEVVGTLNDVIRGIVFFLALVVPAAFFAERLLIGAPDIRRQLAGLGLCLLVIWICISQVHPAFELAHPLVILLSFAIMAMALLVMALVWGRFEGHMKEVQSRLRGVHRSDVSRVGASYAAFMLGISNMRRRRLRTGLTLTTLVLLTFTVLSFTTFEPGTRFLSVSAPQEGPYEGLLIRDRGWLPLAWSEVDYAASHFAPSGTVSPRLWYVGEEFSADSRSLVPVFHGDRRVNALGLVGLSLQEPRVTGVDRALRSGSWFRAADEPSCLVSAAMAASLELAAGDTLRLFGTPLRVRGVFDGAALMALHDLDGAPLTPVDFGLSPSAGLEPEPAGGRITAEFIQELRSRSFTHQDADRVLVLPFDTLRGLGGWPRSLAVRFEDGVRGRRSMEDYLRRVAATVFAGFREPGQERIQVASFTSLGSTSVGGLGALIVPVFIAGLIVLNTMLGAVYERTREIGIYSSVGLAPGHIAMLFIAEACVYAVLGITLGYLLGQGLGKVLLQAGWLGGLSLNYSSMAAVYAALVVILVVLASTAYPARAASQMAVPDVVRRWVPPEPAGTGWEFQFPFVISRAEIVGLAGYLCGYFEAFGEESVGDFYTRGTTLTRSGEGYEIAADIWLAPLELGVSQRLVLRALPEADPKVYGLHFQIDWTSGETEAWKRLNRRFFKVLRKRFLIWYALREEDRAGYREETLERLGKAAAEPA